MTFEQRIRIFLTKYAQLVNELGIAIADNRIGNDCIPPMESPLLIVISDDVRAQYEDAPGFLPFYGTSPEDTSSMYVVNYDDNLNMSMIQAYSDMPTYDEGYAKKTDEQVRAEMRARGINV